MLITSAGLRILEAPDRKVTYNLHWYLQLPDCSATDLQMDSSILEVPFLPYKP